jgi:uncharacterized protein YbjT (DUF2867 family)
MTEPGTPRRAVITGAFSYTGAAIAAELLARGWRVHTLTNRQGPPGSPISASPLRFEPDYLRHELREADVFVNTYWIRLPHAGQTFATAVERSAVLLDAAVAAGVKRLVQISVSNAHAGRALGYYRGKADVEDRVRGFPGSHAIVRPTLVVGPRDVLTTNVAWLLRRFPCFPVPAGRSRLQPITLADTARIIADAAEDPTSIELDAAGPEVMTFMEYVRLVASACRVRRIILPAPAWLALAGLRFVEPFLGDVVLTREELLGLERELLLSHEPPRGKESVGAWLSGQSAELGRRYVNDRRRHFGAGRTELVLDPSRPLWR